MGRWDSCATRAAPLAVQVIVALHLEAVDEARGHPDHEAAGRASRHAASAKECRCLEAPIWGWHWAAPEDGSFPWPRAVAVRLGEDDLRAKHRAIAQFRSQLEPDPSTGNAPILPGFALARVLRPFEVLLR